MTIGLLLGSPDVRAGTSSLRLEQSVLDDTHAVGNHLTVTATATNTGPAPVHDVVVMLSLLDTSVWPAIPLGLEDWTPAPEAVQAPMLAPGGSVTATWRLRLIQGGRLAIYASAIANEDPAVVHSRPFVVAIVPAKNLTPRTVLPVALGIPIVVVAAGGGVLWSRRRRVSRGVLAILTWLTVSLAPSVMHAADIRLMLEPTAVALQTGNRVTVTATVANTGAVAIGEATIVLNLVDMTQGHAAPLALETWTAEGESIAIPPLAPGASVSATWHLVMIQPGRLGVYASVFRDVEQPLESSRVAIVSVDDRRVLNPANVLPIAIGEPLILMGAAAAVRVIRRTSTRQ